MKQVEDFLEKLIINDEYIIVAVSSGSDSMCLLDLLMKQKYKIVLAHVNHNQRKESITEEKFLEDFCNKNNIIFESHTISKYEGDNFQQEARNIRYQFFYELLKKYNSHFLFTAHHGDDLIETVLMRITRGSSLKGYAGFEKISFEEGSFIIRPLITLTKENIINYNKTNSIQYFDDVSNSENHYTRNRYRHNIVPELKKEYENIHLKYIQYSETLLEVNTYINKVSNMVFEKVYINDELIINIFLKQELLIQKNVLMILLEKIYDNDIKLINSTHIKQLISLCENTKPNLEIMLPNDLRAIKSYDKLYFEFKKTNSQKYNFIYNGKIRLPDGNLLIDSTNDKLHDNNCIRLNSYKLTLPIIVRCRCEGDTIQIKNSEGHTKVNKIFIDQKIDKQNRELWPIVTDSDNNILWIPGLKKSIYDEEEDYNIVIEFHEKR